MDVTSTLLGIDLEDARLTRPVVAPLPIAQSRPSSPTSSPVAAKICGVGTTAVSAPVLVSTLESTVLLDDPVPSVPSKRDDIPAHGPETTDHATRVEPASFVFAVAGSTSHRQAFSGAPPHSGSFGADV